MNSNPENYVVATFGDIKSIGFGDMDDNYQFELDKAIFGEVRPYSDEAIPLFRKWCEDHNVYYYARPRESFSELEAWRQAREVGADYVLMEDMS